MKRLLLALVLSLVLGALGLYLASPEGLFNPATYRNLQPTPGWLVLCAVAFVVQWGAPALKIALLCRTQSFPVGFRRALLVSLSSALGSALTPGKSGGGPVVALALKRLGLPLGKGLNIILQVLVLDMLFYALSLPLSLGYLFWAGSPSPAAERVAVPLVMLMIGVAVGLVRFPRVFVRGMLALARWRPLKRFSNTFKKGARDYYRSAAAFRALSPASWLTLMMVTAVGWLGNYGLLWGCMGLYGLDIDLPRLLASLNLITFGANLVPTPGGSGFIEAAVGVSLSQEMLTAPLLLWRVGTYYAVFLLGPVAGSLLYRAHPLLGSGDTKPRPDARAPAQLAEQSDTHPQGLG